MSDDPFADPPEEDRTMMRPRPGGRGPARHGGAGGSVADRRDRQRAHPAGQPGEYRRQPAGRGRGRAVAGSGDPRARPRGSIPTRMSCTTTWCRRVRDFEKRALTTGLDTRSLRAARYALCATLDDLILSTPWGSHSIWGSQSLVSIFHNEVSGGERTFDILEQMQKEFGRHRDVVELIYLCMSLGFEGKYRVLPRGMAALTELRDSVYRMIRNARGDFERDLSIHWRGVETGYRPLSQRVPLWMIAATTALLAGIIYLFFNFSLAAGSDDLYAGPAQPAAGCSRCCCQGCRRRHRRRHRRPPRS